MGHEMPLETNGVLNNIVPQTVIFQITMNCNYIRSETKCDVDSVWFLYSETKTALWKVK